MYIELERMLLVVTSSAYSLAFSFTTLRSEYPLALEMRSSMKTLLPPFYEITYAKFSSPMYTPLKPSAGLMLNVPFP